MCSGFLNKFHDERFKQIILFRKKQRYSFYNCNTIIGYYCCYAELIRSGTRLVDYAVPGPACCVRDIVRGQHKIVSLIKSFGLHARVSQFKIPQPFDRVYLISSSVGWFLFRRTQNVLNAVFDIVIFVLLQIRHN